MKIFQWMLTGALAGALLIGCSKKDEDKPSASPSAKESAPAKEAKPSAPVKADPPASAAGDSVTDGVEKGVAELIGRLAAVAEKHKGKCAEQGTALKAEGKKMEAEIKQLAEIADKLRTAGKLDYGTYEKTVMGEAKAPTLRFQAAIEGCEMNGLGLVVVTIPIFKKDVPPPPK